MIKETERERLERLFWLLADDRLPESIHKRLAITKYLRKVIAALTEIELELFCDKPRRIEELIETAEFGYDTYMAKRVKAKVRA